LTRGVPDLAAVRGRDVEAEHHPALVVFGNVAVSHPPSDVRDIQQDVDCLSRADRSWTGSASSAGPKRVGLRLHDVAELLEVMDRGQCPCGHTDALLRRRLGEINDEIMELAEVRDELERLLDTHPPAACP
jgi:hypothetical protein